MSILTMNRDLAIVQKLSDLPNSTDGLTAAQLKAKFDEGPLAIQSWINETLVPSITAATIPFVGSEEINADNIDAAVRAVHQQIRDAVTGTLVNGSVTKIKLSEDLLARTYGGRPWVSLNIPGSGHSPETDYPVGQLWLRPEFTVSNAAGTDWTPSGCSIVDGEHVFTITGNNTAATVTATQTLQSVGNAGDRVYVLFGVENRDSEIAAMTVSLNGGDEQDVSAGAFITELTSGKLNVTISVTWPATSLAGGSVDITNFAVVNVDKILRQTDDTEDMADWPGYLTGLLPLESHVSSRELFVQTASGVWQKFDQEVFPVERGGTGLNTIRQGELLIGGADNTLEPLAVPSDGDRLLQLQDGKPVWSDREAVVDMLGSPRITAGSYTGSGSPGSATLSVTPQLLFVAGPVGANGGSLGGSTTQNVCVTLMQSCTDTKSDNSAGTIYNPAVQLSGASLIFSSNTNSSDYLNAPYMNKSGGVYTWIAIY